MLIFLITDFHQVRTIKNMTVDDFAATMRPKTIGTQNLLPTFQNFQLDTFLVLPVV